MKKLLCLLLAVIMIASSAAVVSFAVSKPAKVTGVKVSSVKTDSAKVSWKAVSKATGYIIYKYIKSSKKYVKLGSTTGTSKTVNDLKAATSYAFCVSAYKKADGKTVVGAKSALVSFTTKSASDATKKQFYSYLKKHYTAVKSSGFPTKAKSGSIVSAKILDFDGDKALEMVTFTVTNDNIGNKKMTVSFFEIKKGKGIIVNSLKNLYSLDGAGNREAWGCSFVKGKKILVSSDITSFGASVCVSNRRVIAVKNGKLKMTKDFHYYYSRGREGFIEEVSGKTYSCLDDIMTAWGKAGFKGHEHKYEKSSDISGAHIYAYHSYGSGTETTCSFFVDKTNVKSHLK